MKLLGVTGSTDEATLVLARGREVLASVVRQLGHGLGTVFFIPNPWIGLVFWMALFSSPRLGLFALLGLLVGIGVKRFLNLEDAGSLGGGIKANALLTSVAAAWQLSAQIMPMWVELALAATAAAMTAVVTAALMSVLAVTRLPVMAAGYCLIASMLFTLCPQCTVAAAGLMEIWTYPTGLSGWLAAFVRSLGSLVYSPTLSFGTLVCVAFLLWSRTAFLAGVLAWLGGVVASLAFVSLGFDFLYLPQSYNFFISGVALGAVLYLPSRNSLLLALFSGVFCAVVALTLQVTFAGGAIAYLPLSSMLTIWACLAAIGLAGPSAVSRGYTSTRFPPEVAWLKDAYLARRFGGYEPLLALPLAGPLHVSQSFAGEVTHRGKWQHAIDFHVVAPDGQTNVTWGCWVLSPGSGVVESIKTTVPDNPLGGSDFRDNWGNYVLIRLDRGGWVLLAHLMQGSVCVSVGMRVEIGTALGRVGNSGRSPVPHLHLQLQRSPEVGAPTAPFKLANFLAADSGTGPWQRWQSSGVPELGAYVQAALPNPLVYDILTQMMPGAAVWFCEVSGEADIGISSDKQSTMRVQVAFDEAGRYRFDTGKGGWLVAGLEPDAWRIMTLERVHSSLLDFLALAIPAIPYAASPGMTWDDVPPVPLQGLGFGESLSPFFGKPFSTGHYVCEAAPQGEKGFVVKAFFASDDPAYPLMTRCRIEPLRGPVDLFVELRGGSIHFSQLSFEPGLPLPAASGPHPKGRA